MSLLDLINQAGGSSALDEIGARVGLSPEQTMAAAAALMPALGSGLKQQVQAGGLSGAIAAAAPGQAADSAFGNEILGQIFGSKDVSRSVAANASAQTGIGADTLKSLLPMLATLAAGTVASKAGSGGAGLEGMLGMLDRDGDGNPMNEILGMAGKFFGR